MEVCKIPLYSSTVDLITHPTLINCKQRSKIMYYRTQLCAVRVTHFGFTFYCVWAYLAKPFYSLKHVRLARGRCECLFVHITCLRVRSGDGFVPITSLRVHSGDGFVPITSLRVHSDDWLSYNLSTCSHRWRACPYNYFYVFTQALGYTGEVVGVSSEGAVSARFQFSIYKYNPRALMKVSP